MNKTFTHYLKKEGYSQSTIHYHQQVLSTFQLWAATENVASEAVTYNDILAYLQHRQHQGTGKAGLSRYLTAIKHYYDHLIEQGIATSNPVQNIKLQGAHRKKLYDILSPSELQSLYQHFAQSTYPDEWRKSRDVAIIGLVIFQGLTTTDIKQLHPNDLQLKEGLIQINRTRRSNERTLKLEVTQLMDLHHYATAGREKLLNKILHTPERLFFTTGGKADMSSALNQMVKRLQRIDPRVQNIKHLRACVITKWLKKYGLRKTQYLAGHRYLSSTEKYKINDLEGMQEEINQYHPLG